MGFRSDDAWDSLEWEATQVEGLPGTVRNISWIPGPQLHHQCLDMEHLPLVSGLAECRLIGHGPPTGTCPGCRSDPLGGCAALMV